MIPEEDASNIWVLEIMGYTGAGAMSGGSIALLGSRDPMYQTIVVLVTLPLLPQRKFFLSGEVIVEGQNERISRKNNEILK